MMEVVVVKFRDPTTFGYWATTDEVDKLQCRVCFAVGILVEENDSVTKVALLYSEDKGSCSNWVSIPTPCVLSCDVIKTIDWEVKDGGL